MSGEDGGSAADKARELDRIQRQAQAEGRAPGGLSEEDLYNLENSERQADYDRIERQAEERHRREFWDRELRAAERSRRTAPEAPTGSDADTTPEAPTGSILDDIDTARDALGVMGLAPDPRPQLTGGMLDALKRPETMVRLIGAGLGLIGMLLLSYGLRAEAGAAPAGAVPSASPTAAAATGSPVTQASPSATAAAAANRPPEAGALQAVQIDTSTIYTVQNVRDPDGDVLRYAWTTTNPCGTLTGAATPTFTWAHPHTTTPGSCPAEPLHPAAITVQIDDGRFIVTRQYIRGSAAGLGAVPLVGAGIATIAPSPTVLPTTTSRPATATPTSSASPTTATGGGPNLPLALFGGLLAFGGLGLVLGGPRIFGGPRIRRDRPEDPCAKEKQAEAEARARREAARKRLDRINGLRAAHDRAQAELQRAQREEAASKDDRTTSWGQVDGGERIYTNKDQRARIERAEAAARAAREAADASRSAYEGAGNGGEATAAQDELSDADRLWERANAALARCLRLNAPPPPPPPPPATPPPPTAPPSQPVLVAPTPPVASAPRQRRTTTEVRYRCSLHCDLDPKAYRGGMGHANSDLAKVTVTLDEEGREISRETEEDVYDFAPRGNEGAFWVVVYGVDGRVDRNRARNPDAPRLGGTHMYYDISEDGYNAAKAWADGQVEDPPTYRATTSNCVDFAVDLVAHAGVTTPEIWSFDESNFYVGGVINVYTPSLLVAGILAQQEKCEHSLSRGKPFKADPEAPGGPDFWVYECTKCGLVRKGRTANGPDE